MPADIPNAIDLAGHALLVPLRSNAYSLVTGAGVSSVRRRLKMASIAYETLLLESGVWEVSAGEDGSFSTYYLPDEDGRARMPCRL